MKTLILFIVGLLAFSVNGQIDAKSKEALVNLKKKYGQYSEFDIKTTYLLYKGETGNEVIESYSGIQKRKNDLVYLKIGKTENLSNSNFNIRVDHSDKEALIQPSNEKVSKNLNIEDLLKKCSKTSFSNTKDGSRVRLFFKSMTQMEAKYVDIYFNPKKNTITKVVIMYNVLSDFDKSYANKDLDYPRLEIIYEDQKFSCSSIKNINEYITMKNGKWVMKSPFQNYSLNSIALK